MGIEIRGLAPLLEVFDMLESIRFYRDKLGFELAATSGDDYEFGWAMLSLNGTEIMLNAAYETAGERPAARDPLRVQHHKDTTLYFGCPDPDAAYQHLIAKGVTANAPHVAHYGMKQVYLLDPDGYNLCFQWPAAEAAEPE